MTLPCNTPMLKARNTGNWTCPDNVWRCSDSPSLFITCDVDTSLQPGSTDHLPIVSTINLKYLPAKQDEPFNYKTVNWEEYMEALNNNLANLKTLLRNPLDCDDIAVFPLFFFMPLRSATPATLRFITDPRSTDFPVFHRSLSRIALLGSAVLTDVTS